MNRILFVSNGHGEEAIAARIAHEVVKLLPEIAIDHLALVGDFGHPSVMHDVGPRSPMPSGGLIAMGNVKNISRDIRSGLLRLTLAQLRFLRSVRKQYNLVIAVGDTFALMMAMQTKTPAIFAGTAKSVYVAHYGPFEERIIRRTAATFVRDTPTAESLRKHGIPAEAPGNVIVDLFAMEDDPRAEEIVAGFAPAIALFPGSRQTAYFEAQALANIVRELARSGSPHNAQSREHLGAALSIAPGLDVQRFIQTFANDGWVIRERGDAHLPFILCDGERELIRAWRGGIGALLSRATLVIGQAGTANEAAAAAGVPIVALDLAEDRSTWYRKRQRGLLGDALLVVPANVSTASSKTANVSSTVREIGALLDDPHRLAHMSITGKNRMGPPGGAHAIAQRISAIVGNV